jgi:signal transduction histidine kinase
LVKDNQPPIKTKNWKRRIPGLRGFTLQLFIIIVLPLTALLLIVAFASQTLHHEAMRSLVGDRDLRIVRAASSSLEREISHLTSTIQIISRGLEINPDFSSLILKPQEISAVFDGGIALFSEDGQLVRSSSTSIHWQTIPTQNPEFFTSLSNPSAQPIFSNLIKPSNGSKTYILIGIAINPQQILIGAFSPDLMIGNAIGDLSSTGQTTVLVVNPSKTAAGFEVLYRAGPIKTVESSSSHPGIKDVLAGESGINYFQSTEGEHVVAFNPIPLTDWGLVIEEAWEDIASPYLITTQSAPLVVVPILLLALLAIWFGARSIVSPLQNLEKQAAKLADGDFEAISQPVGGIEEIRNLQFELVDMADKLKAAQATLRTYIGAITSGVENERRSLARELHDDTIQSLIALNQRIQLVLMNTSESQKATLVELQGLVQQSMNNLRRVVRGLRPIYLEDLGLVTALEMLASEISQAANIPISFTSSGEEKRLDQKIEMSLYRMVQESLNNVIHHSGATQAWLEVEFADNHLTVQIRDNGKGFMVPSNPSEFPEKGHFGLLGLHERAEIINADLQILSTPGEGTKIFIQVKLAQK